jgi:hypothetical protein
MGTSLALSSVFVLVITQFSAYITSQALVMAVAFGWLWPGR